MEDSTEPAAGTGSPRAAGDDSPRPSFVRRWPAIVAGLIAAVLVALAALIVVWTGVDADKFWEDAVGALLAAAGGVVITGIVGVAVNRLRDDAQDDKERLEARAQELRIWNDYLERQIVRIWELHERVKRSAVLIAAHKSAKTYGEELRDIIAVRTALSDVQGAVERRRRHRALIDFETFAAEIGTALAFLNPLIDEFRRQYLSVSVRQRVDEAENTENETVDGRSMTAWEFLSDPEEFPQLDALIQFGELTAQDYDDGKWATATLTTAFLDALHSAVDALIGIGELAAQVSVADDGAWPTASLTTDVVNQPHRDADALPASTTSLGSPPT